MIFSVELWSPKGHLSVEISDQSRMDSSVQILLLLLLLFVAGSPSQNFDGGFSDVRMMQHHGPLHTRTSMIIQSRTNCHFSKVRILVCRLVPECRDMSVGSKEFWWWDDETMMMRRWDDEAYNGDAWISDNRNFDDLISWLYSITTVWLVRVVHIAMSYKSIFTCKLGQDWKAYIRLTLV